MNNEYFKQMIYDLINQGIESPRIICVVTTLIEQHLIDKDIAESILAEFDIYYLETCNHCTTQVLRSLNGEPTYCSGTCENCAMGIEKCRGCCRKNPETK